MPIPLLETIQIRGSPIHGLGLFAQVRFPPFAPIIEYVGERISKSESLRRQESGNPFLFCLDDQWDLDGNLPHNWARYINHSCAPNSEARWVEGRIWIMAKRAIPIGEEITFNYGYDLDQYRDYPCHCGSAGCTGYMIAEEFQASLRQFRLGTSDRPPA